MSSGRVFQRRVQQVKNDEQQCRFYGQERTAGQKSQNAVYVFGHKVSASWPNVSVDYSVRTGDIALPPWISPCTRLAANEAAAVIVWFGVGWSVAVANSSSEAVLNSLQLVNVCNITRPIMQQSIAVVQFGPNNTAGNLLHYWFPIVLAAHSDQSAICNHFRATQLC